MPYYKVYHSQSRELVGVTNLPHSHLFEPTHWVDEDDPVDWDQLVMLNEKHPNIWTE